MITVIGLDGSPLTPRASAAIAGASLVLGGRRQLAAMAPALAVAGAPAADLPATGQPATRQTDGGQTDGGAARLIPLGPLRPALDVLAAHEGDAVVLASGDPGFFGIVRALRERGLAAVVLPAVSSVSLAFARAGLAWDDALVVSAHGREMRCAVNVCRAHPKVAVLTGPGQGPAEIGAALAGWPRRLLVAECLGGPDERITECSPAAAAERGWAGPNVVLVLADPSPAAASPSPAAEVTTGPDMTAEAGVTARAAPGWCWAGEASSERGVRPGGSGPSGWALPEEAFEHRDSMITKAEVRALALARLAPRHGVLVWDVGAGSGSVAVECARLGAAVIAVDRDQGQCARVAANARRHGVEVRVVGGQAPAALDPLPDPDAVFVGGGGLDVVAAVAARQPGRIVVALAAVDRAGPVLAALGGAGYAVEGTLLQAARLAPLPDGTHRLAAVNPVLLLWGSRQPPPGPVARPPEDASPTEDTSPPEGR